MLCVLILVTIIVISIILSIDTHNYYSCKYNTNTLHCARMYSSWNTIFGVFVLGIT